MSSTSCAANPQNSMLRRTVSRIRLAISALGCVVLGVSLFNWAQGLQSAGQQYTWVGADESRAAPIETAEIWQVSARCVRPYFTRALLRSDATLKAYYNLAPAAVRAGLDHSPAPAQSGEPTGRYRLVKGEPEAPPRDNPDMEYVAELHVQYAEWYANVFKLELAEGQWQQRLDDVADQRLVFTESARKSFRAYSGHDTEPARAASNFDDHVMATLGLGGFPGDEALALRASCVKIDLVKKISKPPDYAGELWRWPVEQTAAFALGLELVFIGIFLVPVTLWIATGNPQVAAQHIRDETTRLVAGVTNFDKDKFIAGGLARLQAIRVRALAFLFSLWAQLGLVVNRQVQRVRRMAGVSYIAIRSALSEWWNAAGKHSATSPPPRPAPGSPRQWRSRCARIAAVRH
jgi:hypothetical protein